MRKVAEVFFRWLPVSACLFLLLAPPIVAKQVPGRYIVELTRSAPIEAMAAGSPPAGRRARLRNRREQVWAQQRVVRRMLAAYGARVYGSVDTVANALMVRLSGDEAERLKSMPGVRRVTAVWRMWINLERAINIHKVPEGWARIGGSDLAGAGVKIGIIDSGIDPTHPGFVDPSIPMPEGFPRVNQQSDLQYTSNKVIVARSYLSSVFSSDGSALDSLGHGTAVAMAAAGVMQATPEGPISGVAPKAWLGNYKVIDSSGSTTTDAVLKAVDDAVRDGMDVLNLSLGSAVAARPGDDFFVRVVQRISAAGVVVVAAAGNSGPGRFTMGDTGISQDVLAVGASWNDRILGSEFRLESGQSYDALPGNGPKPPAPVTAPVVDVETIDSDGLACNAFPDGSLGGKIAFILRGDCFFEEKINNADAAGAVAALIYTHAQEPDAIFMDVGSATLPAIMVSNADGLAIKAILAAGGEPAGTVNLDAVRPVDPNRVASFSSRGPSTDLSIKPDLVAVGASLNTADLNGGFSITQGTSFSAPIVAGAVAVLQSSRPGYTARQYRSLLVNNAAPLVLNGLALAPVQISGGGVLDLDRALASNTTAYPVSVSFGDTTGPLARRVTISNLGTATDTYTVSVQAFDGGPPPQPSETMFAVPAGAAHPLLFTLAAQGAAAGEHQGFLWVRGSRPGSNIHIPYWYALPDNVPKHLNIVWTDETGVAGQTARSAIGIRVTDAAGLPIISPEPAVTVVSGGGSVIAVFSDDDQSPGLFASTVRLGAVPGSNVFRIQEGDLSTEVTIEGE